MLDMSVLLFDTRELNLRQWWLARGTACLSNQPNGYTVARGGAPVITENGGFLLRAT
jgi:hypothetical protein